MNLGRAALTKLPRLIMVGGASHPHRARVNGVLYRYRLLHAIVGLLFIHMEKK